MNQEKLAFLSSEFIPLLQHLPAGAIGKWGKMNGQQMVEHLGGFFKVSTGKLVFSLVTPPEKLPLFKAFLLSEKEFKENTKAPVLPEDPLPIRFATQQKAIIDLEKELDLFNKLFLANANLVITHPVFGPLNYQEWVLLHYKHVVHHLKQFGLL